MDDSKIETLWRRVGDAKNKEELDAITETLTHADFDALWKRQDKWVDEQVRRRKEEATKFNMGGHLRDCFAHFEKSRLQEHLRYCFTFVKPKAKMTTLRKDLNEQGFDFSSGRIVYKPRGYDKYEFFIKYDYYIGAKEFCAQSPDETPVARVLAHDDPILDIEYYSGHGGEAQPQIMAEDDTKIYFYVCSDGATWLGSLHKDLNDYLTGKVSIETFGG